jgi:tRNA threonylcarbamoyladenosine biosynthesis protein TsaB
LLILGIDTSTKVATAALIREDNLLGETFLHTGTNHSRHLLPLIAELLRLCQIQPKQLQAVAVALGPGSFTGLRIGLATGKGLASALGIPLIGIPTLDGLAYNLTGVGGVVCPILDARKKQVYTALYSRVGASSPNGREGKIERITPFLVVSPEDLATTILDLTRQGPVHFLGDGVPVYREELKRLLPDQEILFAHQPNSLARGAQIAWLGLKRLQDQQENFTGRDFHALTPLYLRASEAEVSLERKKLQESNCL